MLGGTQQDDSHRIKNSKVIDVNFRVFLGGLKYLQVTVLFVVVYMSVVITAI
jgi:hypothetical protein